MAAAELRLSLPEDRARVAVASALTEQGFVVDESRQALAASRDTDGAAPAAIDVHLSEAPEGTLAVFAPASDGADAQQAARLVGARLAQQGVLAFAAPAAGSLPPIPAAPLTSGSASPSISGYPGASSPPAFVAAPADRPVGAGILDTTRTNVLAIVALVLGFVVPIAGVVTGAVALSQIKRTGEKGRGLALGGIVAGGVLTLFLATVVIGALLLSLFTAVDRSTDPYAPPEQGGVSVAPDEQAPFDPSALVVGACLDDLPGGFVTSDNVVDCAVPHSYEAFGGFDVPGAEYPGDDAIEAAALDGCEAAYAGYVGVSYQDSRLDYYYVGPTAQTWAVGDREIFCLLYDPEVEQTTGSLAGSRL